ncbi:MAG: hypothetical protein NTW80_02580 [Deltaproteobacteria bacterium]|nr:hypothetical protein [Deltaproteobacteria bacterium]
MKTRNPKGQIGRIILCLTGVLWLAGCYGPSAIDLDYGNSVRNNLAQTILNPQAGLTNTPATGLNPTAAANEKEMYDKGFKGEEKKPMTMQISQ